MPTSSRPDLIFPGSISHGAALLAVVGLVLTIIACGCGSNGMAPLQPPPPPPPPPGSCSGTCPTFVQQATGADTHQATVTEYDIPFANLVGSGNAVLGCVQWASGAGTLTVTDDKSNSYTLLTHLDSGNTDNVGVFYKMNISNAPRVVKLNFTSDTGYVSGHATEFYNVGTATDGAATGTNGSGTSIASGSITTTVDNDLIYQCATEDGGGNPATWTAGSSPWSLLSADGVGHQASQWQVQASHTPINPTMTMSPIGSWNTQSVALKSAPTGTAPAAGIRVVGVTHGRWPMGVTTMTYQIPAFGNLLIANPMPAGSTLTTNCRVSSITDSAGNSWSQIGSDVSNGTDVVNQLYYAPNATTSSALAVTTNLTCINGDSSADTNVLFLDVAGAATAPYDSTAGLATATGNATSGTSVTTTSFTPTAANELVFSSVAVATNSLNAVSLGYFLAIPPVPDQQDFLGDQNNGFAIYYAPNTSAESYVWTETAAVGLWAALSAAFKAP